eukprot:2444547-Prymnesium_polylepis.1
MVVKRRSESAAHSSGTRRPINRLFNRLPSFRRGRAVVGVAAEGGWSRGGGWLEWRRRAVGVAAEGGWSRGGG